MERIFPITFPALLMRNGEVFSEESVCELGIFGKVIGKFENTSKQATILESQEIG